MRWRAGYTHSGACGVGVPSSPLPHEGAMALERWSQITGTTQPTYLPAGILMSSIIHVVTFPLFGVLRDSRNLPADVATPLPHGRSTLLCTFRMHSTRCPKQAQYPTSRQSA